MTVNYATRSHGQSQDHTGTQVRIAAQGPRRPQMWSGSPIRPISSTPWRSLSGWSSRRREQNKGGAFWASPLRDPPPVARGCQDHLTWVMSNRARGRAHFHDSVRGTTHCRHDGLSHSLQCTWVYHGTELRGGTPSPLLPHPLHPSSPAASPRCIGIVNFASTPAAQLEESAAEHCTFELRPSNIRVQSLHPAAPIYASSGRLMDTSRKLDRIADNLDDMSVTLEEIKEDVEDDRRTRHCQARQGAGGNGKGNRDDRGVHRSGAPGELRRASCSSVRATCRAAAVPAWRWQRAPAASRAARW